jgi:hypothetical protein
MDHSLQEAAPQRNWLLKAQTAIARSEIFIVMLGPKTNTAPGVLKEVAIAKTLRKKRFQVIGYQRGSVRWAVPSAGEVYRWNWTTLKRLLG